jgi:uronate dehydrogenase
MRKVLMTGAGGYLGSRIRPLLRDRFDFRAVDVRPTEDEPDSHVADITKLAEVTPLMDGVDVVMHLAIASQRDFRDRREEFNDAQLDVNVKGTYHVLEAARRAEVRRVVLASSIMTIWGYPVNRYVSHNDPACPNLLYGATKYCGEVLAELYAREHGLSVVCWRLGQPADHGNPAAKRNQHSPRDGNALVSFVDIANGFAVAAEAEGVPFGVFPLLSDNPGCYCDTSAPRFALGYEPVHRFTEDGVETLRAWP